MMLISSRSNPKVKQVRLLRQRKARQESGLFLVEGIRHVGEAIQAGATVEGLYYAPDLLDSAFARQLVSTQCAQGVACYALTADVFESLADKDNPQGILAVLRTPCLDLEDVAPDDFPWGVALVSPQDPGNLGAILRTIDAVGASGLILLDSSVDAYHPTAVRASMGALFWHPVISTSFSNFAAWANGNGYHVYGSSAHGAIDYREMSGYEAPRILLLGSERQGLTPEQTFICECIVRLPMCGRVTSLNLAVAAGVLLYDMLSSSQP